MTVHQLSRLDARRIAVRAQLLDAARPAGLLDVVRRLTMLQIDPTAAVAPNADLVAWSRLGSSYSPAELLGAAGEPELVELQGDDPAGRGPRALPRRDGAVAGERASCAAGGSATATGCEANDDCRRDILERLDRRRAAAVARAPGHLRGAVGVDRVEQRPQRHAAAATSWCAAARSRSPGGEGRDRLWDLAERVYPDDPVVPAGGGAARSATSGGCARWASPARAGPECPVEPLDVGDVGEPAVVEGVRGTWRVDPAQLGQPFAGRAALLSPFDRLVYDRKRMDELFEFDYQLEMYKPVAKRRWGYFALPILYGDRLVGKLDATADRKAGVLRVDAIHEDEPFDDKTAAAVRRDRGPGPLAGAGPQTPRVSRLARLRRARHDPGCPAPVSPAGGRWPGTAASRRERPGPRGAQLRRRPW